MLTYRLTRSRHYALGDKLPADRAQTLLCRLGLLWGLLGLLAPGVAGLYAQKPTRSGRGTPPQTAGAGPIKVEELTKLKTSLDKAAEALPANPKQATALADTVIQPLDKLRSAQRLSAEQGQLYEDALLIKARARFLDKDPEGARRTLRQILIFNPAFARPVPFAEGQAWMEQMRATQMGSVTFSTAQSDVTVKVGGRVAARIGNEPVTLTLPAGNYEVTLEKEDYLPRPFVFTLDPGATRQYPDISLKREFFSVPFFVNQPDVEILVGDTVQGRTKRFTEVMAGLNPKLRDDLLNFLENENINPTTISFALVNKVPMTDSVTFTFHKPCAVDEVRALELPEKLRANLNNSPIFPLTRSVCLVNLVTTESTLNITANLPGAEVYLDDELLGETPVEATVCPGKYTLLVHHEGGKKKSEIEVGENEDIDIEVALKPSLTFLGIYPSEFVSPAIYQDAARVLSEALERRVSFFNVEVLDSQKLAEYFSENSLDLGRFIANLGQPKPDAAAIGKVAQSLSENLDTSLFLIGYFDLQEPSPTTVTLALFSHAHPQPDITRLDFRSPQDLRIFINKLDLPEQIANVFYEPWFGAKMIDVEIGNAVLPVVVDVQSGSPAKTVGLRPGDVVLQVDEQARTTAQIIKHLGVKKPDDVVRLRVRSLDGSERAHQVAVIYAPVEISLKSRDLLYNVYLTKLTQLTYAPPSDTILALARFNSALVYVHFQDWNRALGILNDLTLAGTRGISQGTVHYYRGRCYENLGDKENARAAYQEALTFDGSTVGSSEGPLVATLARERLNGLK